MAFAALLAGAALSALAQEETPAGVAPEAAVAGEAAPAGPPIIAIELLSDAPLVDVDRVLDLVTQPLGAPYDEREARRSLRNLEASGVAAEAELWTRPAEQTPSAPAARADGGLVLEVALWTNIIVDSVDVLGDDRGLSSDALRREIEVSPGQPLLPDRVLRSVYRLLDRYRAEGYFDAKVRSHVEVDASRKRARVSFNVAAGHRATIGTVTMSGALGPFSTAQLTAELRERPGEPYRQSASRDDAERLRRWLHEQDYRQAEVEQIEEHYDRDRQVVDLAYRVDVHGKLTLTAVGATVGHLRRKDLLPFLGDAGYDEATVLQAVERIKLYYQERGHYRVQVETREEKTGGEDIHLEITIRLGPVYTLEKVTFTGNEGVSRSQLLALMTTNERRTLVLGSGRLVDEVAAADIENIRSYYALSGWTQAKVGPPEVTERGAKGLVLTIPVVEGPRTRVVDLELEGVKSIAVDDLRKQIPLKAGGPFHPLLLDEALDAVRARYEGEGYPYAQVSASTDWNADHTLVDVTLRVLEGARQVVANVIIRGNQFTKTGAIRTLAGLAEGEPVSRGRLLEVQRNLYRLGIFSRVEVTLAPSADDVRERDVVIEVEEGRNQRVAYGLGYDSEVGIGGLLRYSHANLFGEALHFQLEGRASQRDQRYRLYLDRPYWGGKFPGGANFLLYKESERRPTFHVNQRGVLTELSRGRIAERFSLFVDYRRVKLGPGDEKLDISELPPEEQRAFQNIEMFALVPRFIWDDRDDPIDPHRGKQVIAQAKYAFPIASIADEHFFELFGQAVHLWDLRRPGVVAASVRAGGIEALGGQPVSIDERFFAGGRTTHRAYSRDELGIPGKTVIAGGPIGGKGLLLFNLDYRFPISGSLGGTVFVDAGNVWADWRDIRFADIKTGVGLGVRYLTPIGPLRIEVGWKLEPEPGESSSAVLVSVGNAF